ncbi:7705_t:CDS:2 [Racocetra persica]|uniref:7705_t:CDS:1 n=1 Tax=Racocetra persica TaxID=160502 RepID=A0ACA9NPE3_9GLOM|nr:7705_t:CDS:2 [Racocetra persica]
MNRDPIVTRSKANSNISEALYDELDSSSSSNEQESDNFDEFEVTQDIESLDNLIEFEQNQETESSDIEISTSHDNDNSTENNLIARSNKQQPHIDKTATSSLDRHIQTQHIGLYDNFCQTTLDRYLHPEPYPYNIQEKK